MESNELGHFSLLEKIGEGGMGRVYKARDKRLERFVAIKLLAETRLANGDRRARFVQEAKAASALNHPNIITIHEIGEQDGQTFIAMELVDGKPLNELIPRKGMRLAEALRIAAQVAGALTTAHAAGIVHRDLKPANIMVDGHGRVKVLDFGLAKLSAPAAVFAAGEDQATVALDQPVTEEGMIIGSVPYMSPEQAEGKPVDARSDIFSFGAVLYEMITGQRAFRGESRASTLAAVVEKDPQAPSEVSATTPPELDRLIARCLRKDINRRSQNMADVKLALEELRDESESGKLVRAAAVVDSRGHRWMWPAVAIASVLIAAAAFAWIYLSLHEAQSKGPTLVRVSPDDGHTYSDPAISPDGGFVAYISDRSGKDELWLQQVGGGDPIQLTHSLESVSSPSFFPDGKRILYITNSAGYHKGTIEVISALGGQPRVLIQGDEIENNGNMLSPDGLQIAYFERNQFVWRLMTLPANGGPPQELPAWARLGVHYDIAAWTSDSRYLLCVESKKPEATTADDAEWFAFPVDGGNPVPTGAGDTLRAAGLARAGPIFMTGDRVLFWGGTGERINAWEIRLSPGSWRAHGVPRQLTFGTLHEAPVSISAAGTVALDVGKGFNDFYMIPLSPATGQPSGAVRRLTQDGRYKNFTWFLGGDPNGAYFSVGDTESRIQMSNFYALDLDSGKQTLVTAELPASTLITISPDGRQVAYSVPEGDSYSIRVGDAGARLAEARVVCKACGQVLAFSPDGRFLFHAPETKVKVDTKRKLTMRLLEVASGKDRPWLELPTDSVFVPLTLGQNPGWLVLTVSRPGSPWSRQRYLLPWRDDPAPQSEWKKIPLPDGSGGAPPWRVSPAGTFFYLFEGSKLTAVHFDPQLASFSEHREVKFLPGSAVMLKPDDVWTVRGPGLVFSHREYSSSVWLMKLPR
jgi:Tol biopolymer transport system component/tRNA A-37 threonylcarbamoyl transferase component Bud32